MYTQVGITWLWSRFALGALFAVPAMIVAPVDPTFALALAIGVLPAAAFGLPPTRRGRAVIPLIGLLSAIGLTLGSLLTHLPPVAVVAMLGLSIGASLLATRGRLGQIVLILVLPMTGIGLSFPDTATTLALAGCIVAGSVYAWAIALIWPDRDEPPAAAQPTPRGSAMLTYGILLGLASASAAALGYLLGLEHVGWATAAVLLVMRPVRGQLVLRSVGRAASVLLGAFAAAAFALLQPSGVAVGVLIGLAVASMSATQQSRWYVAPAFTTLIALTLILSTSPESPADRFVERTGETLLGVGLALLFGAVIPTLIAYTRNRLSRAS